MGYDFDKVIERRGTGSLKWGSYGGRDVIPMWVADMDFQAPPVVLEALHRRVAYGVFGYAKPPEELTEVVVERLRRLYGWTVDRSWIVWLPGLVPGLHLTCRACGDIGDEVLTFVPVYPPFLSAPPLCQRKLKQVPLRGKEAGYTLDLEAFEQAITEHSKLLLFCNPHNPVGRMFGTEEIRALGELCLAHGITICSDEIHCDLILDKKKHVPMATVSKALEANTITLMSAAKTFNVAGLNCGFAVIAEAGLRKRFMAARQGIVPWCNPLGYTATLAAYRDGAAWHEALLAYLRENRRTVCEFIGQVIPQLSANCPEATYLSWIDTGALAVDDAAGFFEKAGVGLSDGRAFGEPRHVRLNFGCSRQLLHQALERMKQAVDRLGRPGVQGRSL